MLKVLFVNGVRTEVERKIMRGVMAYARDEGSWTLSTFPPVRDQLAPMLTMNYAGCLGLLGEKKIAALVRAAAVPAINISGGTYDFGIPRVGVSDHEVGVMAADYLHRQGFETFAFYGLNGEDFSDSRRDGFVCRLRELGLPVDVFDPDAAYPAGDRLKPLDREMANFTPVRWLAQLPPHTGILASDDVRGNFIGNCAAHLQLRIPEDIGLLGVGNDSVYCETAAVPMSSIETPAEEIGYEAARCLHLLMRGSKDLPAFPVFRPPTCVIERQSTDLLKIRHPNLAKALSYMHDHAREKIVARSIAQAAGMSLRSLERIFHKHLNRTIQQEVTRIRLDLVKADLRTTDKSLDAIGIDCGLSSGVYLSQLFRKNEGASPGTYRRRFRH